MKLQCVSILTEEEMDGEAVMAAFATCSGPDCIKDIIKTYGSRLKVYTALKAAIGESYQQSVSMCQNVLLISILYVLCIIVCAVYGICTARGLHMYSRGST